MCPGDESTFPKGLQICNGGFRVWASERALGFRVAFLFGDAMVPDGVDYILLWV